LGKNKKGGKILSKQFFIENYKYLANKIFGKRFTDEYFDNAAVKLQATRMNDEILKEVFSELSIGNQMKTEIHAAAIRELYWQKYKKSNNADNEQKDPLPCKKHRCDGKGLVHAIMPKGIKLPAHGGMPTYTTPIEYDIVFRCDCILGQQHEGILSKITKEHVEKGYRINRDFIYTEKIHNEVKKSDNEKNRIRAEKAVAELIARKLF